MRRTDKWIDVYPFKGRDLEMRDSGARIDLTPELSSYVDRLWKPKEESGWKSSWVCFTSRASFENDKVVIDAGAVPFHYVSGMNVAIEDGKDFAPRQGYVNSLSVGFLTATKDGKVIFQRRAPDVHCPNILIHEPCGYMASIAFANRSECDNPRYANDPRLFDVSIQLDARRKEIADTFSVPMEAVSYNLKQDLLACGWRSTETYFSCTGRLDVEEGKLKLPERGEFFFVPLEYLRDLIMNQGRLSSVDPTNHRPEDPREIPLIDESLAGLIWGYEELTGDKLDIDETVDRLNRDGLSINVFDTSPRRSYDFPNSF